MRRGWLNFRPAEMAHFSFGVDRTLLSVVCPHCGSSQLPLDILYRPGYCSYCHRWLGQTTPFYRVDEVMSRPQYAYLLGKAQRLETMISLTGLLLGKMPPYDRRTPPVTDKDLSDIRSVLRQHRPEWSASDVEPEGI